MRSSETSRSSPALSLFDMPMTLKVQNPNPAPAFIPRPFIGNRIATADFATRSTLEVRIAEGHNDPLCGGGGPRAQRPAAHVPARETSTKAASKIDARIVADGHGTIYDICRLSFAFRADQTCEPRFMVPVNWSFVHMERIIGSRCLWSLSYAKPVLVGLTQTSL